jgi:membrane protein
MKQILTLFKETAAEWSKDNAPRLGAALAYYSLFSIGPCLLIAVTVAGWVFGAEAVSGELFTQLRGLIGDQGASAVQALIANTHRPAAGAAGAIGIVTLLIGATGVVVELKNSLNAIWEVEPKPGRGLRVFIKKYIVSLGAVMGFGFVLMVSLVLSTVVAAAGRFVAGMLPLPGWILQLANFATLFVVVTLLIAGMFTYLPDVRLRFRTVLPGAAVTTVLFMVG